MPEWDFHPLELSTLLGRTPHDTGTSLPIRLDFMGGLILMVMWGGIRLSLLIHMASFAKQEHIGSLQEEEADV